MSARVASMVKKAVYSPNSLATHSASSFQATAQQHRLEKRVADADDNGIHQEDRGRHRFGNGKDPECDWPQYQYRRQLDDREHQHRASPETGRRHAYQHQAYGRHQRLRNGDAENALDDAADGENRRIREFFAALCADQARHDLAS